MFGFLTRLFGVGEPTCTFENYSCHTPVKLQAKVRSPLGSNISAVMVTVDITYAMMDGSITIRRVRLANAGGSIGDVRMNVASARTGEAWYAMKIGAEAELTLAVLADLDSQDSWLRKAMTAKWRQTHGNSVAQKG